MAIEAAKRTLDGGYRAAQSAVDEGKERDRACKQGHYAAAEWRREHRPYGAQEHRMRRKQEQGYYQQYNKEREDGDPKGKTLPEHRAVSSAHGAQAAGESARLAATVGNRREQHPCKQGRENDVNVMPHEPSEPLAADERPHAERARSAEYP